MHNENIKEPFFEYLKLKSTLAQAVVKISLCNDLKQEYCHTISSKI